MLRIFIDQDLVLPHISAMHAYVFLGEGNCPTAYAYSEWSEQHYLRHIEDYNHEPIRTAYRPLALIFVTVTYQ